MSQKESSRSWAALGLLPFFRFCRPSRLRSCKGRHLSLRMCQGTKRDSQSNFSRGLLKRNPATPSKRAWRELKAPLSSIPKLGKMVLLKICEYFEASGSGSMKKPSELFNSGGSSLILKVNLVALRLTCLSASAWTARLMVPSSPVLTDKPTSFRLQREESPHRKLFPGWDPATPKKPELQR